MDIMQAIEHRRSVRKYSNAPIDPAAVERLERIIAHCNAEGGLRFQLCLNDPARSCRAWPRMACSKA